MSLLQRITHTQKKSISKYSQYLYDLRTLSTNLQNSLEIIYLDANIETMSKRIKILTECYANCSILLDQFIVLLKSCPDKAYTDTEFDLVLSDSPIVRCFKNSDEWNELYKKIKALLAIVTKQKTALLKLEPPPKKFCDNLENVPSISEAHIDTIKEARSTLGVLIREANILLETYRFTLKHKSAFNNDTVPHHPLFLSLVDMIAYLKETIESVNELSQTMEVEVEENSSKELINQTEDMVATMLLIIQSIYKKHLPAGKGSNDILNAIDEIIERSEEKEQSKDLLEDKHLKEHLQEKLSSDAQMLQLESIIEKLQNLLSAYVQYMAAAKYVKKVRDAVMRMVPILEQTILFVQYFVTQKVAVHRVTCKMLSVLLKIFTDLANKG